MPRTARASVGGFCYHVINRGNARAEVFRKPEDYGAFLELLRVGATRVRMRVLAYCLMPNHFHLALWPRSASDLSRFMQWLLTAHVRRYHRHYHSSGHIWQGRFKAFPIQQDEYLLTVLRYIERNPLRAGLAARPEDWLWSSARDRGAGKTWVEPVPVPGPRDWLGWLNAPMTEAEVEAVRHSVNRGTPFGSGVWVQRIARRLGLEASLRPRGGSEDAARKVECPLFQLRRRVAAPWGGDSPGRLGDDRTGRIVSQLYCDPYSLTTLSEPTEFASHPSKDRLLAPIRK